MICTNKQQHTTIELQFLAHPAHRPDSPAQERTKRSFLQATSLFCVGPEVYASPVLSHVSVIGMGNTVSTPAPLPPRQSVGHPQGNVHLFATATVNQLVKVLAKMAVKPKAKKFSKVCKNGAKFGWAKGLLPKNARKKNEKLNFWLNPSSLVANLFAKKNRFFSEHWATFGRFRKFW